LAQSLFEAKNMTGSTILMPLIRGAIALLRATLRVEVLHGENLADLQPCSSSFGTVAWPDVSHH
jgi:hypothetical protein